jgi:hypothetical protein
MTPDSKDGCQYFVDEQLRNKETVQEEKIERDWSVCIPGIYVLQIAQIPIITNQNGN